MTGRRSAEHTDGPVLLGGQRRKRVIAAPLSVCGSTRYGIWMRGERESVGWDASLARSHAARGNTRTHAHNLRLTPSSEKRKGTSTAMPRAQSPGLWWGSASVCVSEVESDMDTAAARQTAHRSHHLFEVGAPAKKEAELCEGGLASCPDMLDCRAFAEGGITGEVYQGRGCPVRLWYRVRRGQQRHRGGTARGCVTERASL